MKKIVNINHTEKIHIYYMFYDPDNKIIAKNISHTLIYDETDFPKYEL